MASDSMLKDLGMDLKKQEDLGRERNETQRAIRNIECTDRIARLSQHLFGVLSEIQADPNGELSERR